MAIRGRAKGAGNINKINNRFYLRIKINGIVKNTRLRNPDDSPCTNRQSAEAAAKLLVPILLAKQQEEIALHVAVAKKMLSQSRVKISKIWELYLDCNPGDLSQKTLDMRKAIFDKFSRWIRKQPGKIEVASDITRDHAEDFMFECWQRQISPRTYNIYLSGMRVIFKTIFRRAELNINPFDQVERKSEKSVSRENFTREQVDQIFRGFKDGFFYEADYNHLAAGGKRENGKKLFRYHPLDEREFFVLLNLCCWTGADGQCGCLMRWRNVNWERCTISYVRHKTENKIVDIPIHPDLRAALIEASEWKNRNNPGDDFILPALAYRYQKSGTRSGIQKTVMRLIQYATGLNIRQDRQGRGVLAANLYSLHSFRHTFVSFCADAGVPEAVVASIVGHDTIAMTRHYTHISTAAKSRAIGMLPSVGGGQMSARERLIAALDGASEERILAALEVLRGKDN